MLTRVLTTLLTGVLPRLVTTSLHTADAPV